MPTPKNSTFPALPGLLAGLCLALFLAAGPVLVADERAEATRRLEQVQQEMSTMRQRMEAARGEQGRVEAALREAEREIGRQDKELRRLDQELAGAGERLAALEAEQARERERLATQLELLARQLRGAYLAGRQDRLRLLLNQEDPAVVGRLLVYYQRYNQARGQRIETAREDLDRLARLGEQVSAARAQLGAERERQQAARERLEQGRAERQRLLARLETEITEAGSSLRRLEEDEKELEALLRSLDDALRDIPTYSALDEPFAGRRGKLPWPARGSLGARFGADRSGQAELKWRGVVIDAEAGDPVQAIHHGRVVFADWLRGYGLLTILDHGGGYMSLYGHTQSLYRAPGDWVQAGELIARVGDGPLPDKTGLYFEIRHQGKPLNPDRWCDSNVRITAPASRR